MVYTDTITPYIRLRDMGIGVGVGTGVSTRLVQVYLASEVRPKCT